MSAQSRVNLIELLDPLVKYFSSAVASAPRDSQQECAAIQTQITTVVHLSVKHFVLIFYVMLLRIFFCV